MLKQKLIIGILFLMISFASTAQTYDLTVAADGSGNYTTVQAAINAAPAGQIVPYKILVKNGKYREKVTVPSNKTFIQLTGESVANTIIYYDDASYNAGGTSASASFTISANDFSAFNITFANTFDYDAGVSAGQTSLQAVAVLINGDRAAFKNCRFLGNQDTLYENKKGYFKNCYIDGIIDFIFGGGASVFDSCTIYPKTRTSGGSSYITAANTPAGQAYGYVFRDCKLPGNPGGTSYVLGRPWQNSTGSTVPYAENKTVYINSILSSNISAAGWSVWDAGTITSNITYAEYQSKYFSGTPVDISGRVSWSYQLDAAQAAGYSNANVLAGWDPCTVYTGICDAAPTYIAVSNFAATKGVGTATFKWNLSWGMNQVKFELYRSLVRSGSYTKIGEVTTANDTTYNYSYIDNALPPGQQVYYYLLASKAGNASHFTDTLLVSTKPTIVVNAAMGAFQQGGGVPSASQTYTVSGYNLSDNVVITSPANFEISTNNTAWNTSVSPITLIPTSGVLSSTTIYTRMNAATAPGTFSGNIVHTTTGGDNVSVAVNGTSQVAPLTPAAYYRSRISGVLNDVATWETSADSTTWFAASAFPTGGSEENVTIMSGHTVTINIAHTVNGKWTVYGTGANTGGSIAIGVSPGALSFANNSFLVWNRDGGTLPVGTVFSAGSSFNLIGTGNGSASSVLPTINAAQVFQNVVINIPNGKANNPNFNGTMNTINGNLTVNSTGIYSAKVRLTNNATQVINIGGNLTIDPPAGSHATFVLYSTTTPATAEAVNIAGNVTVNNSYATNITGTNGTFSTASTAVTLSSANPSILAGMAVTGTGIPSNTYVVAVAGTSLTLSANTTAAGTSVALTFIQATASLNLTDNSGTGSQTNIKGNITLNNATLTLSTTGLGTININRTDGIPQYYTRTSGTLSGSLIWNVLANAVFDAGTSTLAGNIFTLNAGATLRSAHASGITGNITTTTKNFSSAANYVFNGTSAQTTLGNFTATTPTANTVNSITINNTAGVTIGNALAVNNTLTLTSGKTLLGANSVTANAVTGGSSSNYFVTAGAGSLKINSVGAASTLFPVGPTITSYTPVTLSNSGTADNFSVRVAGGTLPAGINTQPQSDSSVNNTWMISEDVAGGSNASVTIQWNTADQNTLFNNNYCAIVHSNGSAIDYAGAYSASTTPSAGVYTRTGTGFTSFSPFGVNSKPLQVVPVRLLSFAGKKEDNMAKLYWSTADEINITGYEIERSDAKLVFTSKESVHANGTAGIMNYVVTDKMPLKGENFYRLKIKELNGQYSYSNLIKLFFTDDKEILISPNPVASSIHADHAAAEKNAKIIIYSADGKKVLEYGVTFSSRYSDIPVNLSAGNYILSYVNGNIIKNTGFIKR